MKTKHALPTLVLLFGAAVLGGGFLWVLVTIKGTRTDLDPFPILADIFPDCEALISDARGVALDPEFGFARIDFKGGDRLRECLPLEVGFNQIEKAGTVVHVHFDGIEGAKLLSIPLPDESMAPHLRTFLQNHGGGIDWPVDNGS